MRRAIGKLILACGLLLLATACTGNTAVDNEFRFKNYYSVWTGWKGGSKEAAARMIQRELEQRFPKGTPVNKLIDFVGSFDPTFEWKKEGICYSKEECLLAAGETAHSEGVLCYTSKEKLKYICDIKYHSKRAPQLLFIGPYRVYARINILLNEEKKVASIRVIAGKSAK